MSAWFLWPVSLMYLGAAIDFYVRQKYGLSVAFVAYAAANIGLIYA